MQRMSLRRTFLNYITLIKLNYSVFGKTMENITNHKDMNLVTNEQKYQKYVMKPNFKDGYPFSKELLAVEMWRTGITINKPV